MKDDVPMYLTSIEECVDKVIQKVGKKLNVALPLALGKANNFINELYRRAKKDSSLELNIFTALSLERPRWSSDLERRFMEPFVSRVFDGWVDLDYLKGLRSGTLPKNVNIKEFYAKAGSYLNLEHSQHNYMSSNYTHVYRDILNHGVNVIGQIVAKKEIDGKTFFSMSCNPDVPIDIVKVLREREKNGLKIAIVAEVNQNLPFMYGDALIEPSFYDYVVDNPMSTYRLFGAPKMSLTTTDYMIGLNVSALIKDGGTLQIGIGNLGDAVVYSLILREKNNDIYREILKKTSILDRFGDIINGTGGMDTFKEGLNGSTEMLVDGYMHLMKNGIVKRKVYNNECIQRLLNDKKIEEKITPKTLELLLEHGVVHTVLTESDFKFLKEYGILRDECGWEGGSISIGGNLIRADLSDKSNLAEVQKNCLGKELKNGIIIFGGFFLGPESFYKTLRDMSEEERKQIYMTSVLRVNQLYENEYASEELKILQRNHARLVNACFIITLSGAACSDALESGQVVSGVGGQYNFVSMGHALPEARSILMCKSTRSSGKDIKSNIVYNYGHLTIPKHLRDIYVTEYGIADLRGKTDEDIIKSLINIADSRFQEELLVQAKAEGKISAGYEIPEKFRNNLPERLDAELAVYKKKNLFPVFPLGCDFTDIELVIGKALKQLKSKMSEGFSKVSSLGKAMTIMSIPEEAMPYLERLNLGNPSNASEKMMRNLVVYALGLTGIIKKK